MPRDSPTHGRRRDTIPSRRRGHNDRTRASTGPAPLGRVWSAAAVGPILAPSLPAATAASLGSSRSSRGPRVRAASPFQALLNSSKLLIGGLFLSGGSLLLAF